VNRPEVIDCSMAIGLLSNGREDASAHHCQR
jgi:hypothetical protein